MANYDAATREIADKWGALLDEIAERQVLLKDLKAQAKEDGFNLKCLAQIVREKRRGAKYQADQLMLELEINTYRQNYGLPVDVEDAQERARREADGEVLAPDDVESAADDTTVRINDGPEIPFKDFQRAARSFTKRGRG